MKNSPQLRTFPKESIILYDGWALAYDPNGPAAIHLHTLLSCKPAQVQAIVALPARSYELLPMQISEIVIPTPCNATGQLIWEQKTLPGLAKKVDADLLHLTTPGPALFAPRRCILSPTQTRIFETWSSFTPGWQSTKNDKGVTGRLREALTWGGLSRVHGLVWPTGLPVPETKALILRLDNYLNIQNTPQAWDTFRSVNLDLPDNFILAHGISTEEELRYLLEAWNWAAGSIGEYYPLLLLGLNQYIQAHLDAFLETYVHKETVRSVGHVSMAAMSEIYHRSSALLSCSHSPIWGSSLQLAIASAKPVVTLESKFSDALAGPAAYLVKPANSSQATNRLLGAALVTIIVEESVANQFSQAAKARASAWQQDQESYTADILELYRKAMN